VLGSAGALAAGLTGLSAAVAVAVLASLALGSVSVPLADVFGALSGEGDADAEAIVRDLRLPRTVVALVAGLALGASGAVLQGLTRNPLADPGILGVNAGAALAVVIAIFVADVTEPAAHAWVALLGGLLTAAVVLALGSSGRDGATPVKLALAGTVVGSLLAAITWTVLVLDVETLDRFRFWIAGSVAGREVAVVAGAAPVLALGFVIALGAGRYLNALALGDDLARTLGQRVGVVRAVLGLGGVALAAGAVAMAGPIAFVGLAGPHAARVLAGPDNRWIVPYSAVLGALVLLLADVAGRLVAPPTEIEVGIVCAVLGGPVFIALVRRRKPAAL
jgi:iron complex transport system permease protein